MSDANPAPDHVQLHLGLLNGLVQVVRHIVDTVPAARGIEALVRRLEANLGILADAINPPPPPAPPVPPAPPAPPQPDHTADDPAPAA